MQGKIGVGVDYVLGFALLAREIALYGLATYYLLDSGRGIFTRNYYIQRFSRDNMTKSITLKNLYRFMQYIIQIMV